MSTDADDPDRHAALRCGSRAPRVARWLGAAGLLPQVVAVAAVLDPNPEWHFTGLASGYAYAALILSFLGGMWWGLAAQSRTSIPRWVWLTSVAPSLIGLISAVPWAIGDRWPGPSLGLLGFALLGSLAMDYKLQAEQLCPPWWFKLRAPLSITLGVLTLALGYLA